MSSRPGLAPSLPEVGLRLGQDKESAAALRRNVAWRALWNAIVVGMLCATAPWPDSLVHAGFLAADLLVAAALLRQAWRLLALADG